MPRASSSRRWPGRAADHRRDHPRRVSQVRGEGPCARAPVPADPGRRAQCRRDQGHPPRLARPLRGPPQVSITDNAINAAAELADRYISDRFLPDKAIDLIDEAGSKMRIKMMTAPPGVKEIDERLRQVRAEKEAAIEAQEFEKAAALRDARSRSSPRSGRWKKSG